MTLDVVFYAKAQEQERPDPFLTEIGSVENKYNSKAAKCDEIHDIFDYDAKYDI